MIHRAPLVLWNVLSLFLLNIQEVNFLFGSLLTLSLLFYLSVKNTMIIKQVTDMSCHGRLRATLDDRNEKIGKKIRDNELKENTFMIIVGEKKLKIKKYLSANKATEIKEHSKLKILQNDKRGSESNDKEISILKPIKNNMKKKITLFSIVGIRYLLYVRKRKSYI